MSNIVRIFQVCSNVKILVRFGKCRFLNGFGYLFLSMALYSWFFVFCFCFCFCFCFVLFFCCWRMLSIMTKASFVLEKRYLYPGSMAQQDLRSAILHYLLSGDISRLNFSNLASTGFHIYSLLNSVLNFKCFKIHEYGLLRIIDCYIREIAISGFNIMIERKKAMCFSQNLF